MPTSAFAGRGFFTTHMERVAEDLETIIDFGAGEGTYSILGRHIAPNAKWTGVEIFEPYFGRYDLDQKYDFLLRADVRSFNSLPYTLGIFGDILEHLDPVDAIRTLFREASRARYLYVSVPIIPAPQGPSHGNNHEAHLHDWSFEEMDDLIWQLGPDKWDAWRGHTVGRWWIDL